MNKIETCFLEAIHSYMRGQPTKIKADEWSKEDWSVLERIAVVHSVFPMVFDGVYQTEAYCRLPDETKAAWKRQTIASVMWQARISEQFLKLYQMISDKGINCLVVKGIVCRQMYRKPDYRCSNDEDLYVSRDEFLACHQVITEYGLSVVNAGELKDVDSVHVISYADLVTGLHIELHQTLFEEDSKAYGYMNNYFKDAFLNAVSVSVQGTPIKTLSYTDNMLYLICHALKHFVMRGFGIRQVCDMLMFAETYGSLIDWKYVNDVCREINADIFMLNIWDIGKNYLGFSREKACMGNTFTDGMADSAQLLEDLLESGVFGNTSEGRFHSNSMTLDAVANKEIERSSTHAALGALFPPYSMMQIRYPILKKMPWLLPVMWVARIFTYLGKSKKGKKDGSAKTAFELGKKRVELMKKYKIIK